MRAWGHDDVNLPRLYISDIPSVSSSIYFLVGKKIRKLEEEKIFQLEARNQLYILLEQTGIIVVCLLAVLPGKLRFTIQINWGKLTV